MQRRTCLMAGVAGVAGLGPMVMAPAWAHHGWSSFDQRKPLWLEGRAAAVRWRNPHAELELELPATPRLPDDLPRRAVPAQSAAVDGPALLAAARLPGRREARWTVELAPLTRLAAWGLPEITPGTPLGVLGFTFEGERGEPVLRAEYVWVNGKAYGMRSSPA